MFLVCLWWIALVLFIVCVCVRGYTHSMCGGQRVILASCFSPSEPWGLGIDLPSSGLAGGAFPTKPAHDPLLGSSQSFRVLIIDVPFTIAPRISGVLPKSSPWNPGALRVSSGKVWSALSCHCVSGKLYFILTLGRVAWGCNPGWTAALAHWRYSSSISLLIAVS